MRRSIAISSALLMLACKGGPATPPAVSGPAPVATPSAPVRVAPPPPAHAEHAAHAPTAEPWSLGKLAEGAVLFGDLGQVKRKVTTGSPEAQAFFDQGLALTYGFNHDEAARSFARAAQLDPGCAPCFWGVAYTLGPNYNMPMLPERARLAWEALTAAQRGAAAATPAERALIEALAKRYKGPEYVDPAGMRAYNVAYAEAMRDVARRFPQDDDVQVLFAEALMNVNPWKLWAPTGEPAPGTPDIVKTLEVVLARAPQHAGANHYYIHAVEASKAPHRAIAAADRLPKLVPGAGHLVHMPAHIYQRVGRYADASEANRRAAEVDEKYLRRVKPPGYYAMYTAHNYGFLAYSASMQGRSEVALSAARRAAESMPRDIVCGMPGTDFFLSGPLLVQVRFGRWGELLATPEPGDKYPVLRALHRHARGMALAATGKPGEARAEAAAVRKSAAQMPPTVLTGLNAGKLVLELAAQTVEARAAEIEKAPNAIELWRAAVALEDQLAYNEPADWFYPTRHYLGAALLDLGRAAEAEVVYRADLERNPKNGWALFGLSRALGAQKKVAEQRQVEKLFKAAWKDADVALTRSAFLRRAARRFRRSSGERRPRRPQKRRSPTACSRPGRRPRPRPRDLARRTACRRAAYRPTSRIATRLACRPRWRCWSRSTWAPTPPSRAW